MAMTDTLELAIRMLSTLDDYPEIWESSIARVLSGLLYTVEVDLTYQSDEQIGGRGCKSKHSQDCYHDEDDKHVCESTSISVSLDSQANLPVVPLVLTDALLGRIAGKCCTTVAM